MNTENRFEAVDDDYGEFDKVQNKRSQRPDLHAFLLLDELFPAPGRGMVSAADYDKIWLEIEDEQVDKLTDEQILELVRCGVMYDGDGSLAMSV